MILNNQDGDNKFPVNFVLKNLKNIVKERIVMHLLSMPSHRGMPCLRPDVQHIPVDSISEREPMETMNNVREKIAGWLTSDVVSLQYSC